MPILSKALDLYLRKKVLQSQTLIILAFLLLFVFFLCVCIWLKTQAKAVFQYFEEV